MVDDAETMFVYAKRDHALACAFASTDADRTLPAIMNIMAKSMHALRALVMFASAVIAFSCNMPSERTHPIEFKQCKAELERLRDKHDQLHREMDEMSELETSSS